MATNEKKIAVLSDIHANSLALTRVLKDIKQRKIQTIINLGDSLYGPLQPRETYELIQHHNMLSIKGNEDRLLLQPNMQKINTRLFHLIQHQLPSEAFTWLHTLKTTMVLDDMFLCHGTPTHDEEYLFEHVGKNGVTVRSKKELTKRLSYLQQSVIICGHSHIPRYEKLRSGTIIINPGSVGLQAYTDNTPYAHAMQTKTPHARYCIIYKKNNTISVEFIRLIYDWDRAADTADRQNFHDWAQWLRTGKTSPLNNNMR